MTDKSDIPREALDRILRLESTLLVMQSEIRSLRNELANRDIKKLEER